MKRIDISLVLPCFNEADHFNESISKIYKTLARSKYSFELLFVEDKSIDGTEVLVKKFIRSHENASALFHSVNWGRGQSVTDGMQLAKGTFVGYIDIDCEVSPDYIPNFIERLETGVDGAIGFRQYGWSIRGIVRTIVSKAYSWLVKITLNSGIADTEAGYKFFRRNKILPILKNTKDTGWFWDTEIIIRAQQAQLKLVSIPVNFNRRIDKKSTVHLLPDSFNYLVKLIRFKLQLMREKY